jgi:hypothetical protein
MHRISCTHLLLALVPFMALLAACETVVEPVGLPYVERLVVRGVVESGSSLDSIRITRTLPLTEEYSGEKAAVADAEVTVRVGGQSYQLQHIGRGYYGNRAIVPQAGERYTLDIAWHGKHVTATTTTPFPVAIDSAAVVATPTSGQGGGDSLLEAYFRPHGDQVYALAMKRSYYYIPYGDTIKVHVYSEIGIELGERIGRRGDTTEGGTIRLGTGFWVDRGGEVSGPDTLTALLYTYDEPFYDYYQTFHGDDHNDGPFATGGETVAWNVEGDGIGMFIGRAVSQRQVRP